MSLFILGILTGWLVEWLFYTFYWKNRGGSRSVEQKTEKNNTQIELDNKKNKIDDQAEKAEIIDAQEKKDDLSKLYGIGPSMVKRLKEIGISSFRQLGEIELETLKEKLVENGARINNKEVMASWKDQAKLADKNDFDGLKLLQEKLKKS